MKIIITGRHIEITDAMRNYLEKKLSKIEKHFDYNYSYYCDRNIGLTFFSKYFPKA